MSDNRDMGIEFGDLSEDLDGETYPLSKSDLLSAYGDRELEHANGSMTLREALEPLERESFDGPDAVHQAVLTMVGRETEGRPGYSDRGGMTPDDASDDEARDGDDQPSL